MGFTPCDNSEHKLKISKKDLHMNWFLMEKSEHNQLFSKLNSLCRKVLFSLALTTERFSYENDCESKSLERDWESKFENLSREELMEFIFEKADCYKNLNNIVELFNQCGKYGYDLQN